MKPLTHSRNSVKIHGGTLEDYLEIHTWFDYSKAHYADYRHRALRHHTLGIFECEAKFGHYITNGDGKKIAVRELGEQHVKEDLGCIPTVADWLQFIQPQKWMSRYIKEEDEL